MYLNQYTNLSIVKVLERLSIDEECFKELLVNKYETEHKSYNEISKELGFSIDTISSWCRKFNIPRRTNAESLHFRFSRDKYSITITNDQRDIINGLLLGDGCIRKRNSFTGTYAHGTPKKETLDIISGLLPFKFSLYKRFNKEHISGKKIFPSTESWQLESLSYPQLVSYYNQWYENNVKQIPESLKLNPLTVYWWYIGDGSLSKSAIMFCTKCFNDYDLELLQSKILDAIGIPSSVTRNRSVIITGRDNILKLFSYIGICKNPEYEYKWSYIPPKSTFSKSKSFNSEYKTCSLCKIQKQRTEENFYRDRSAPDGLTQRCCGCISILNYGQKSS